MAETSEPVNQAQVVALQISVCRPKAASEHIHHPVNALASLLYLRFSLRWKSW